MRTGSRALPQTRSAASTGSLDSHHEMQGREAIVHAGHHQHGHSIHAHQDSPKSRGGPPLCHATQKHACARQQLHVQDRAPALPRRGFGAPLRITAPEEAPSQACGAAAQDACARPHDTVFNALQADLPSPSHQTPPAASNGLQRAAWHAPQTLPSCAPAPQRCHHASGGQLSPSPSSPAAAACCCCCSRCRPDCLPPRRCPPDAGGDAPAAAAAPANRSSCCAALPPRLRLLGGGSTPSSASGAADSCAGGCGGCAAAGAAAPSGRRQPLRSLPAPDSCAQQREKARRQGRVVVAGGALLPAAGAGAAWCARLLMLMLMLHAFSRVCTLVPPSRTPPSKYSRKGAVRGLSPRCAGSAARP